MSAETIYRSCPTCEASCGLTLSVDPEQRQVLSVKGDPLDHRSRGYVCAKSQAFRYVYEDPERLRRPVRKEGEGWREVSWEEALTDIAGRLAAIRDESGKDAIAMYYGNPNGHNFATQLYTQLFISMLNTERFFSAGSVDQQPKNLSCELLYGNAWAFPIPDLDRTDFFVCMGGNPLVSQGSLMSAPDIESRLRAIQQRGGQVAVLDPRRSETAQLADRHLFIRPGTDALLLFAWVNVLFAEDRVELGHLADFTDGLSELQRLAAPFTPEAVAPLTGVPAADLRALVQDFDTARAPVLYGRIGLCTQRFGTLASWLVDVVNALQGRLDAPGGAMFPRPATGQNEPTGEVNQLAHGRWHSRARGFPEYMSMLPASCMAEELECSGADRVRALLTVAGNPVLSVPNGKRLRSAMQGLDLVVALDFYINETTSQADYILPSTTQLEHSNYDFLFTSTCVRNFARYSPRVLEPEPDSRDQWQIMTDLVARMNGMDLGQMEAMMLDGLVDQLRTAPHLSHLDADTIKTRSAAYTGPERLLDLMLRAGPYGDSFESGAEGLNLQRVMEAPHGIDLGPLQPQLPRILRTPGQRLNLVPPLIAADVPRLRGTLEEPRSEEDFLLIGRRQIRDMNSWLHNIPQYVRGRNRCTLLINPADADRLGIGARARVVSRTGSAEVDVEPSEDLMPGVVSLPHGWGHRYADSGQSVASERAPGVSANDLVDDTELDLPSGTSVVNGARVQVYAVQGL